MTAAAIEVQKPRLTLLDLGAEAMNLEAIMEQACEDNDDATFDCLYDYLQTITEQTTDKLEAYAALIKEYTARAKARKEEADSLAALANADKNKADRMKERLKLFFEERGLSKTELRTCRITLSGNGGVEPLSLPSDAESLPKRFQRIIVEADSAKIRAALQAGEEIPGCHLMPRGTHILIK